jgi:hypothetical protein
MNKQNINSIIRLMLLMHELELEKTPDESEKSSRSPIIRNKSEPRKFNKV